MSTKTLRKRIALVAVSAMGFGLLSVVPTSATVAATVQYVTGSSVLHRTDAAADSTFTIEAGAALTAADAKDITLGFTRNSVAISGVPSGISIDWNNSTTAATGETAANPAVEAGNVLVAELDQANLANGDDIATVTVGRTMAPGTYTVTLTIETNYTVATSLTFRVVTAPTSIGLDKTSYAVDAAGTGAAVLTLKDAQLNPSYLLPGEAVDLAMSGGIVGATRPTLSSNFLDSVSMPNTATTKSITITGQTAGSYTLTVSRAAGLTGVASATAAVSVGSAPETPTSLSIAATTFVNSTDAGNGTYDETGDATIGAGDSQTAGTAYVSTAATTVAFASGTSATSGNIRFTVAANGSGLPAGVTAGVTDVAIVDNGSAATIRYTATLSLTALAPAAGFGYTVSDGTHTWTVAYQAPVVNRVDISDSLLDGGTISSLIAGTNEMSVLTYDQFGNIMGGQAVTFTSSGRNTRNAGTVSSATGVATYSYTDTSVSTTNFQDTFTATISGTAPTGAPSADNSDAVTIDYKTSISVATVTLSGNIPSKSLTANSIDYADAISALGTTSAVLKTNTTALLANNGANVGATDQAVVRVAVKDALGNAVAGVRVSFAGSTGVFFGSATSLTQAASIVSVAGVTAVTTKDAYTDANGYAFVQARFTKVGSGTVTASTYGVTSTALAVTVTNAAADARYITTTAATGSTGSNTVASFTVTDGFGNVVSGVDVKFGVSGLGTFLNGTNSVTGTTDASGVVTAALTSATAGTATVTGTVTTSSQAASKTAASTTLGFATGIAAATSTVTMAVTKSAELLAIEAIQAKAAADKAESDAKIAALEAQIAANKATTDAAIAAAQAAAVAASEAAADAAAEAIDAGNNAFDAATSAGEAADAATAAAEQAGEDATAAATAAGEAAVAAAEAAQEAAAEATDAANAATDAANASAEAADAATAAAQDAADAVAALSTQVSEMVSALKKQITALTNLVIKIQKKVKA